MPEYYKLRVLFTTAVARVIFSSDDDSERKFNEAVSPYQATCDTLLSLSTIDAYRREETKNALIGLFADLRGLLQSAQSRATYLLCFDWLYPNKMPIIWRALDAWQGHPALTTLILKFFAEFVQNRGQRLVFDCSSPNGILLFRETSKLLTKFGALKSNWSS